MAELDSILSGKGAVASDAGTVEEPKVEAQIEPATEGAETTQEGNGGQKMVPHEALHAEKQKVKRYTEQVAEFERKQAERDAAWERRLERILGAVPQTQVEKPKAPDFWEDPSAFVTNALSPVQQQMQQQREQFSRAMAEDKHGAQAVSEAFEAMASEVHKQNPQAYAQYQAIMQSPHPYGALVDWFKKRQAAAEIGDDPAAYREKLKAELLAEMQGGQQQETKAAATPVMPSNLAGARNVGSRSGPAWSGPQSLTDIFKR